jgi:hypothetical protein
MPHPSRSLPESLPITPLAPARGPLAAFARTVLRLAGWTVEFPGVPGTHGIVIVYPHTSNWDFVVGLLAKWSAGVPFGFVAKESLFRGFTGATLGRLMRAWGGVPVDRQGSSGAVEQIAATMQARPWCWLAISPEGTRAYRDTLRSGFYFLALRLDLPVGLGFIDFATRRIGCTRFVRMSGEVRSDLALLRDAYRGATGRRPEQASRIAFREGVARD